MATVLIADSDETRLRALRGAFRAEGHRTVIAIDGGSAQDQARFARPALILAQAQLPGVDGYALALSQREEASAESLRIVLTKAAVNEDDRTTARAVGADEIAPFSLGEEGLVDLCRVQLAARTSPPGGVAGEADSESLFAILQFLRQRRETGTLSVSGPRPGTLVFSEGELVGAHTRAGVGKDAFLALMATRYGRYCFDRGLVELGSANLESGFDALLMEAATLLS